VFAETSTAVRFTSTAATPVAGTPALPVTWTTRSVPAPSFAFVTPVPVRESASRWATGTRTTPPGASATAGPAAADATDGPIAFIAATVAETDVPGLASTTTSVSETSTVTGSPTVEVTT